jgi:hypothetical protein
MASKHCPHPSCIVPSGIIKAVEVAADFALPKDAGIKIEKQLVIVLIRTKIGLYYYQNHPMDDCDFFNI